MSAANPFTEPEKAARSWALEQDLTHQQIVVAIADLREQADKAMAKVSEAHRQWRSLGDEHDQLHARAEALKQRLADEL